MKTVIYGMVLLSLCFTSCISQSRHDKELAEKEKEIQTCLLNINDLNKRLSDSIKTINKELDQYRNDPSNIFAEVENYYTNKDRSSIEKCIEKIAKYHPSSEYLAKAKTVLEKLDKEIEAQRKAEEKRLEAERKAEERRAAEEERRNPHTPRGLAKKAARGGWILGIWKMGPGNYTTIVNRNGSFYMYDLDTDNSDIYSEEKLRLVGEGMYKCVDDEDDTIYIASPNGLAAYNYGTQVAFWYPI